MHLRLKWSKPIIHLVSIWVHRTILFLRYVVHQCFIVFFVPVKISILFVPRKYAYNIKEHTYLIYDSVIFIHCTCILNIQWPPTHVIHANKILIYIYVAVKGNSRLIHVINPEAFIVTFCKHRFICCSLNLSFESNIPLILNMHLLTDLLI